MNINRHNYEAFFILYVDEELSVSDRKAIECFLQENPDLEEELVMLQQSKLIPDSELVFGNKDILMKNGTGDAVTMDNYEEWFCLYTDNELTTAQKEAVEQFAAANPVLQAQLGLFQKAKFQPEEIIFFPNKESLYRTEEKVRVVSMRWWKVAAAAVLLFAVSGAGLLLFNQQDDTNNGLAGTNPQGIKTASPVTPVNEQVNNDGRSTTNLASNDPVPATSQSPGTTGQLPVKSTGKSNEALAVNTPSQEKTGNNEEKNETAGNTEKQTNNLPLPTYNPNMQGSQPVIAIVEGKEPSKNELIKSISSVTPDAVPALNNTNASTTIAPDYAAVTDADQSENKSSVRGFLRKITRTFEKTTNIKATDEDDRLLVGGLAIKL